MRTLSPAIQNAIAKSKTSVCHLLSFQVGQNAYRFAEDKVSFQDNWYEPWLTVASPVRYTQKLQVEPVTVRLQNITLDAAKMLQQERDAIQGSEATLQRLFLNCNEALTLFVGRVSEIRVNDRSAHLTLSGDLDPIATEVPVRKCSAACVWTFKDNNCGYVPGTDPEDPTTGSPFSTCPKDFLSCQARGRQHRFSGFIHISRDLTLAVEGQLPDSLTPARRLGQLIRPWEEL
ncbi:MAG: DUF2163 domain-containing protein [Acidobacteria bacterium]|nr:DUF2163 domain-containing protein [Acidobacteriota bacterium]